VTSYLVEAYAPGSTVVADVEARAREAAADLTLAGTAVRFVWTIFIREDETCFHLFEADSIDTVRAMAALARLVPHRIVVAEP
jgi:hypothetical protein